MNKQKSSYQSKLVYYSEMWEFLMCFFKKKHILKELQLAETKLKKIENSEDKSSFINEYVLPLTNDLKQITNFLNPCQQQPQELEAALVDLKKEIEIELQRLENLINLLNQKAKIAAELQILKKDKQQLITAINFNDKVIKDILDNNEKTITELTNQVKASELNVKVLANNIENNLNLIATLQSDVKIIDENLKVVVNKINQSDAIINNLENWSNSIWRRLINILTIGFFCNKKSIINQIKKEKENLNKINQAKTELEEALTAKQIQIDTLNIELTADMKNINSNREVLKSNEKQLDEFYQNNLSSKTIELLQEQNLQKQLLVAAKTNYIFKKQTELWNASIVTINNDKVLDELENQLETSKKQLAVQPLTSAYLHNFEIVIKAQSQIKNLFDAIVKPTLIEENYCRYSENTFNQAITGNMI